MGSHDTRSALPRGPMAWPGGLLAPAVAAVAAVVVVGCVDDRPFDNPCDPLNHSADGACNPPPPDAGLGPRCPDATVDGELCFAVEALQGYGEAPRRAEFSYAFALGTREVTRGEWQAVLGEEPPPAEGCAGPACPVTDIDWQAAARFCNALTALALDTRALDREALDTEAFRAEPFCYVAAADCVGEGCPLRPLPPEGCVGYRMITDAEWSYAATTTWPGGGARLHESAWLADNSEGRLHPVGQARALGGLFDLFGNAEEWTHDAWRENGGTTRSCLPDPHGGVRGSAGEGTERAVRGGHYLSDPLTFDPFESDAVPADRAGPRRGLRLARTVAGSELVPCP